jgi:hypothetical protein
MWDFHTITEPIARKQYDDDNEPYFDHFDHVEHLDDFTFAEKRVVAEAKARKWKIIPGMKYVKCSGKLDGEWCTVRSTPELNAICRRLELWEL